VSRSAASRCRENFAVTQYPASTGAMTAQHPLTMSISRTSMALSFTFIRAPLLVPSATVIWPPTFRTLLVQRRHYSQGPAVVRPLVREVAR
jgi:hypothetical protein